MGDGQYQKKQTHNKYAQPQIVVEILWIFLGILKFFKILSLHFCNFLAVILIPGRLKQLREARRIHFHLSWYLSDSVVPSYDHLREKVNEY